MDIEGWNFKSRKNTLMYDSRIHSQIIRSANTVYLCVLYGSQNKERLFSYTALTDWIL